MLPASPYLLFFVPMSRLAALWICCPCPGDLHPLVVMRTLATVTMEMGGLNPRAIALDPVRLRLGEVSWLWAVCCLLSAISLAFPLCMAVCETFTLALSLKVWFARSNQEIRHDLFLLAVPSLADTSSNVRLHPPTSLARSPTAGLPWSVAPNGVACLVASSLSLSTASS